MSHTPEPLRGEPRATLREFLSTNRPLQALVASVGLGIAAALFLVAFMGSERLDREEAVHADDVVHADEPEPAPVVAAEQEAPEGRRVAPAPPSDGGTTRPSGAAADPAASHKQPAATSEPPATPAGCPQPGLPERTVAATQWRASELFAHVETEQWYVSAWCATDAVARSLGATGWQVTSWSDSSAIALIVKSGLEDDSVPAVEYEVQVRRTWRGWFVDSENVAVRDWCARGEYDRPPDLCV